MDIREYIQDGQHIANQTIEQITKSIAFGKLRSKTSQAAFREEFERQYLSLFNVRETPFRKFDL
jgi:hypothetical protein